MQLVQIIPSLELYNLRLSDLIGQVAEIVCHGTKGCWVKLQDIDYDGHVEWYIPNDSLILIHGNKLTTNY